MFTFLYKVLNKASDKLHNILDKNEVFNLKTVFRFIIISFLSCAVFSLFFLKQINGIIDSQDTKFLEYIKNQQIQKIETYYGNVQVQLSSLSGSFDYIFTEENGGNTNLNNNYDYVENIYVFDNNFNGIKVLKENLEFSQEVVATYLKDIKFTEAVYSGSYFIKGSKVYKYFAYKMIINGSVKGYIMYILNTDSLKKLLEVDDDNIHTEIIDNNFTILYSYYNDKLLKVDINPLTKKILDGNFGTELYNGYKNSYGYVNLKETSLFLNVFESTEDTFLKVSSIKRYMLFLTAIMLITSFLFAWKYIKGFEHYIIYKMKDDKILTKITSLENLEKFVEEADTVTEHLLEVENTIIDLKNNITKLKKDMEKGKLE